MDSKVLVKSVYVIIYFLNILLNMCYVVSIFTQPRKHVGSSCCPIAENRVKGMLYFQHWYCPSLCYFIWQ